MAMTLSPTSARIINDQETKCAETVAARDIRAMWYRNHPILASLDGLLRLAEWHRQENESPISEDYFTGPYWLEAIKNVRNMFSSASPAGFDAGTCEAIFWAALEVAGYMEGDL
jgi:hypothetical protein